MRYEVVFRHRAIKDLDSLRQELRERILERIACLEAGLAGDVKRLTRFVPDYRLRVGQYRVLFEVVGHQVVGYRVLHRREAYR